MTQKEANAIIRATYGNNAIAIGISGTCIFWIYSDESECNYRAHVISK